MFQPCVDAICASGDTSQTGGINRAAVLAHRMHLSPRILRWPTLLLVFLQPDKSEPSQAVVIAMAECHWEVPGVS